jgi:hypothetical protein
MTLPQFAGSLLLVLTLASLSALAPPSQPGSISVSVHGLGVAPSAESMATDTRLAIVESRASRAGPARPALRSAPGIIPPAGEFVPGAGQ